MSRKCPYPQTVLITGASSGIGKSTAQLFASKGFTVYAASRNPGGPIAKDPSGGSIIPLPMDVTDIQSVQQACKAVSEDLGIIIHCAGLGISGSAEMTPIDRAKAQMETNYFGVLNVNSVFLPKLRKHRKSLVLITGSVAGLVSIPYQSHYSSSKYALEAYSNALGIEARQFGVRVCIVEPGDTRTGFTKARTYDEPESSPYYRQCKAAVDHMARDEQKGKPASSAAKVFLNLAYRNNPPVRCAVGLDYKILAILAKILPSRVVRLLVKLIYIN